MSENSSEAKNLPVQAAVAFPDALPLMILRDQVVFPLALVPLRAGGKEEIQLVDDAVKAAGLLAVVAQRNPEAETEAHTLSDAYEVGCIARVLQVQPAPDGQLNVVVQTLQRCRIEGLVRRDPYLVVRIVPLDSPPVNTDELEPMAMTIKMQMANLIRMNPSIPDGAQTILDNIEEAGLLGDIIASNLSISGEEKQKLLETLDVKKRLRRLMYLLQREVTLLETSTKIHEEVKSSIDKGQREYFLRQQLKAIQDELGVGDQPEVKEYRAKIEALHLPEEVAKEALREVDRLGRMNEASAEFHVTTTYLDTILELPWHTTTKDQLDIKRAEAVLDEDHYGLEKVKRRIIEYLAVRKLKPDAHGPILCFQGPPGVGKTSLGKSIARALDRQFVRMALGGLHDEAEIRGHRKTYVGALPGRIIQGIRKAGSNNPVFMLDEIDKVGADFRGDPSSALLEVLDPAQNNSFNDNYLNVPFDLSRVMFIATANVLDTIPWALRDRMEIIELPGYTLEEKLQIARRYLVPRQLDAHGLTAKRLRFDLRALRKIAADYTREAGVRNLEREIANVCRGCARKFAARRRKPIRISPKDLREYLGNEKIHYDTVERTRIPGVVVGLAWTPTGGDILFVEATRMPGKGNLILTGQLGDVMKESAQTALSYLRANSGKLGLDGKALAEYDVHVHVPAGAVPKDGPSAGVTMLTAITSLFTDKRVKPALAMTGEITLRGAVLPVGGIKEKVLAAARAGVKQLILPERCRNDLDDVPEHVRKKLTVHFVKHMHEVVEIALGIDV